MFIGVTQRWINTRSILLYVVWCHFIWFQTDRRGVNPVNIQCRVISIFKSPWNGIVVELIIFEFFSINAALFSWTEKMLQWKHKALVENFDKRCCSFKVITPLPWKRQKAIQILTIMQFLWFADNCNHML